MAKVLSFLTDLLTFWFVRDRDTAGLLHGEAEPSPALGLSARCDCPGVMLLDTLLLSERGGPCKPGSSPLDGFIVLAGSSLLASALLASPMLILREFQKAVLGREPGREGSEGK